MSFPAPFIAFLIKKGNDVKDFASLFKKFISDNYSKDKATELAGNIDDLQNLRSRCTSRSQQPNDATLDLFWKYYLQLADIEKKLPINENAIRICFKWSSAFEKTCALSQRSSVSLMSGAFERLCILFNIAALQSQLARDHQHVTDEGLKESARLFKNSASVLLFIREQLSDSDVKSEFKQTQLTAELSIEVTEALAKLMHAQAVECMYAKAAREQSEVSARAKIAMQVSTLYQQAGQRLGIQQIKDLWPKSWLQLISSKASAYNALSQFHQGAADIAGKRQKDALARYKYAVELMQASQAVGGKDNFYFSESMANIESNNKSLQKDNDLIYHYTIPDVKTLPQIGATEFLVPTPTLSPHTPKGQPAQPAGQLFPANFKGLFSTLVPLHLQQAAQNFEARKGGAIGSELQRLKEATALLNGVMSSLSLPVTLEEIVQASRPKSAQEQPELPPSVLEKAGKCRDAGGLSRLRDIAGNMPELYMQNRQCLDECARLLDDEVTTDNKLRDQFKDKWTRTSSEKLTEGMRGEATKYLGLLQRAENADRIVKEKFDVHSEKIALLSRPDSDIYEALPKGGGLRGDREKLQRLVAHPAFTKLRSLCNEVEDLKNSRKSLEADATCKARADDLQANFLSVLNRDSPSNPDDEYINRQLVMLLESLRTAVSDSIKRQEDLLSEVQASELEFVRARNDILGDSPAKQSNDHSDDQAANRAAFLKQLSDAYDAFSEIKGNLEEGTKFYLDFLQVVLKFQTKVQDYCFARKTEKDELMQDLVSSAAALSIASNAPAPPRPSTPPRTTKPPERPPPPHTTSAPSTTATATSASASSSVPVAPTPGTATYTTPTAAAPIPGVPPPAPVQPYPSPYGMPPGYGYPYYPSYPYPNPYAYPPPVPYPYPPSSPAPPQGAPLPPAAPYPPYPGYPPPAPYPPPGGQPWPPRP